MGGLPQEASTTSTEAQLSLVRPALLLARAPRSRVARRLAEVLLLAIAYYAAAKLGQTLRYTASVSAIWPPAGLGIAALYLWGLRLWPGVLIGELVINTELFLDDKGLPLGSLLGQQTGNLAEIVVGALLLRRLVGPGARLDRVEQVGGMLAALAAGTAVSATVGTLSMRAGGVIAPSEMPTFWRTWWLGDSSGALVVVPLMLAWAPAPAVALRRVATREGALMAVAVAALSVIAVSTDEPVTYLIFPVLMWAALRFGPPGATLSIAIAAGVAIGVTANEVGPFSKQPIDLRTLSTQTYIAVAALTTLLLSALVSERERSSAELAEARRHEGERALEERHRIARDLHDSISQALFSAGLHARSAQKALDKAGASRSDPPSRDVRAIEELTRGAQREMRTLVFELRRNDVDDGLVAAFAELASRLRARDSLAVEVEGPRGRLPLSRRTEDQLFAIGREGISNVLRHAHASTAWVSVANRPTGVVVEIRDDGRGFDSIAHHPGFGLQSMQSRADEIGAHLTIRSGPRGGTVVRVESPPEAHGVTNGD